MAETRTDAATTIPKQHVDESDNSSGNGESIRSIGGNDSLSLNLISGNGEQSRDDSIPTDDSHISTDRHRYYIREVTVSERDPTSSHWETAHDLNYDDGDNQGDDVVDPDINQPQMSANPHLHSWLGNLRNSHAVNDGPLHISRGTQSGAEDGILSNPPTLATRQDRTSTASHYASASQIPSILKRVCIFVKMVCLLYGVGNVIQRLYHLENHMIQSQTTFSQIQDAMKHLEQNQDHSTETTLPDHIDQSMHDISRPSSNDFWGVILFSIISIVAVKICERIDKLEHGHDQTVESISAFDTKIKQQAELSDSHDIEKDKIIRGIQSTIQSLEQSVDKLLKKSQDIATITDEYKNQHAHNMNAMETRMMCLEGEQNNMQDKQKITENQFAQIQTQISVQQENIDNLMEMSSKVSAMSKEGTIMQNNVSQIETKLRLIQDELQSQLDTVTGNLAAHQSEVNKLNETNQVLLMDMTKLRMTTLSETINAMLQIKPKYLESVAKIDLLQKDVSCINCQHTKLTDEFNRLSKLIDVLESNIAGLKVETQASALQNVETAKNLAEMGKLIESQTGVINGLESAQNTAMADVQNDVKILFQHKAELERLLKESETSNGRRTENIETGCKQMKAAILGLFMSLNTQIDEFVRKYDKTDESVALDVVPMMGLAWCSDQTDFRKDDSNEYYTKAKLLQKIPPHWRSWNMNKYETRVAMMKGMTGTYRTEIIQKICSNSNMLKAALLDPEGLYVICKAIESPDVTEEFFTCLGKTNHGWFLGSKLPETFIQSLLNRLKGEKTFAFHLVYFLFEASMKNSYILPELKEQLKIKSCTGLERCHSAHVDDCIGWLCKKSYYTSWRQNPPELSHCTALLIWRLLQSDSSWVEYIKDHRSLTDVEKLATDPELKTDTKQVIIQILGKCDILVSTDTCGSAMPPLKQKPSPSQRSIHRWGSANLSSD